MYSPNSKYGVVGRQAIAPKGLRVAKLRVGDAALRCAALRNEARPNAHRLYLLKQQLARIGDAQLAKVGRVVARLARVDASLWIDVCHHAAALAHKDAIVVRALHKALLEKGCDTVSEQALVLHLS